MTCGPSLRAGTRGLAGPASVQASYLQCSRRGPVEAPPQQPGDLAGKEREREREDAQRGRRLGRDRAGSCARELLPTCSRGLRVNPATTAILTVSSSRRRMTTQQGRGLLRPHFPCRRGPMAGHGVCVPRLPGRRGPRGGAEEACRGSRHSA